MYTSLMLVFLGMCGVFLHNLVKMDSLNRKAQGNFKLYQYLMIEKFSIIISMIVVLVCTMISHEVKVLNIAGKWMGPSFLAMGYLAQSLLIRFMGAADKAISQKIGVPPQEEATKDATKDTSQDTTKQP
jgi:hypothetical protein